MYRAPYLGILLAQVRVSARYSEIRGFRVMYRMAVMAAVVELEYF